MTDGGGAVARLRATLKRRAFVTPPPPPPPWHCAALYCRCDGSVLVIAAPATTVGSHLVNTFMVKVPRFLRGSRCALMCTPRNEMKLAKDRALPSPPGTRTGPAGAALVTALASSGHGRLSAASRRWQLPMNHVIH